MAAANDYFQYVGDVGTATTLSSGYTAGGTSMTVGSTTNWPTTTGVVFAVDEVTTVGGEEVRTAGTYNVYKGTVASGTSITNVSWVKGDGDRNYSAGSGTRVYITTSSGWADQLVDGLLVSHDQDGTLKAGAVDNAALASDVVTTSKILDSNVTTAKLANASVTPAKRSGGFFCGVIAGSTVTTTGIKNITGVGFTPKGVRFTIRRNSSQDIFFGVGAMDENGNQHYMYTVHDVSTTSGGGTNGGTTACMYMPDSSNVVDFFVASYSSMNADGFSINVTDASSSIDSIQYEAFA